VNRCCIIGAGRVGSSPILTNHGPHQIKNAWNS
jgi:hypothetical protein